MICNMERESSHSLLVISFRVFGTKASFNKNYRNQINNFVTTKINNLKTKNFQLLISKTDFLR